MTLILAKRFELVYEKLELASYNDKKHPMVI